tara:strand:- start:132 stop:470 length:339 start_codon:yes stop_codon:yes gene_type:complete
MNRETILGTALRAVDDRGKNYGKPSENFERIASLWGAYTGIKYNVADVGLMMMLVKMSRLIESPMHEDSWVDLAGYSAITAEAIAESVDNRHPHEDQQSTDSKKLPIYSADQ